MTQTSESPIDTNDAQRLYLSADQSVHGRLEEVLSSALGHISAKTRDLEQPFPDVLSVDCDYEILRLLSDVLQAEFKTHELEQVTCHIASPSPVPTTSEFMRAGRLSSLVDQLDGDWVKRIIGEQKLMTYYQPIVHANDPGTVFGYECLTRGKSEDGGVIAPYLLFGRAKKSGLLNDLDCAAFLTAVDSIDELNSDDQFLLNVCPAVANSPKGNLRRMLEAASHASNARNRIVIEVTESERIEDNDALLEVLADFRSAGLRLALDDVGSGYSSLMLLAVLRPELIKIDMNLMRGASEDPYRAVIVRKLLELAQELSIQTVVEGIETVEDLALGTGPMAPIMCKVSSLQGQKTARSSQIDPDSHLRAMMTSSWQKS